jgi:hypothetical protein
MESNIHAAGQEIRLLWNWKFHYPVQKSLLTDTIIQTN